MNKWILALSLSVLVMPASANQLKQCQKDINDPMCHAYIEGVVDGALMFKHNTFGKRIVASDYESRALKYRGGKRFQEANREYCRDRIPNRAELMQGVSESIQNEKITTVDELQSSVQSLLHCQRLE